MKAFKVVIFILASILIVGCSTLKKSNKAKVVEESVDTVNVGRVPNEIVINNPAKQVAGEWTFMSIKDKPVKTLERPFFTLDFSDNRFYGNNGCNVINGTFECDSSSIEFDNIISTMMACDNETSEQDVMKAFGEATSMKLFEKKDIKYLHLLAKNGHTLAILKEQNLNFMNGAWTVEEISGKKITDENVKLVIDLDQLSLHGNSGCNIVNGSIYIDYGKDWGVQFQQLISTMKMCENIKTETALLVALEETETCKPIDGNRIALYDNKGECVAVLKKLRLK